MPGNCGGTLKTILDFSRAKREQHPIVMIAAYDALMARLVAEGEADAILVGDSAAMVVHGFPSTVHATVEMMAMHVAAVRRGARSWSSRTCRFFPCGAVVMPPRMRRGC
jgi:ketopantoate hydroxymethyltransferase